ncbi:MAG TPA: hypothetical protein VGK10_02360 [Prolixibacteraceae bacterium]|jgi:hypothetical protein
MNGRNTIVKIWLLIFLLINSFNVKSQTLKSYQGEFNNGTAKYSYYEDENFNRILQGSFSYICNLYNVKGEFLSDKQTGKWNITATNKVYSNIRAKILINTNISGNFKEGNLDGQWIYSNSMRLWNDFTNKYESDDDKETSTANFIGNKFVGKISYSQNWPEILKIEGQFNNSGILEGTWSFDSKSMKGIIKYMNGVAYLRLLQDNTTGEKLLYRDSTVFVKQFWSNIDTTTNTAIVNGKVYFPQKVRILNRHSTEGIMYPGYSRYDELVNPAITLWTSESITLYGNQGLTSPLCCYKTKINEPPYCYEIIIKEKWLKN